MTKEQTKSYGGVRKKLMGAVAMLLVASIMVVSSTYAWFTLSTAPEITGISTSVGANGNLEIALLNSVWQEDGENNWTDGGTYLNLNKISSAVGDSSAILGATAANLTWGNLVDLSDSTYGLQTIKLLPARLNFMQNDTTKVVAANLLKTAVYGADGRVATVNGTTYASGSYSENGWAYNATRPTYGVRAVGSNDNLSAQQTGAINHRSEYNSKLNAARVGMSNALAANGSDLSSALTAQAQGEALSESQAAAVTALVAAANTALGNIDAAYKALMKVAVSTIADPAVYGVAITSIDEADDAAAAVASATTAAGLSGTPLSSELAALATNKAAVAAAQEAIDADEPNYGAALEQLVNGSKVTINGFSKTAPAPGPGPDEEDGTEDDVTKDMRLMVNESFNPNLMTEVVNAGGFQVRMGDGSGVFAYIGSVAGNYSASTTISVNYAGLVLSGMNATLSTTATAVARSPLYNVPAAAAAAGSGAFLSDTYGYAIDFAVRTNAASSYLYLATDGVQRVYENGTATETEGGGSAMTFFAGDGYLTDAQIQTLMGAIRVAFINPQDGTLYGIAALDGIAYDDTVGGNTGKLKLVDYSVNDNGVMTVTHTVDSQTGALNVALKQDLVATTELDESKALMQLTQNTAARITAVVYLDGDYVDNGDVVNGATSLTGTMNLQFASSAELIPMENTALRNYETPANNG